MERRVVVRGVIYDDGKLFAVKHKYGPDKWATPGGALDNTEGLEYGLKRELMEELGVEPVVGRLLFVQQFYHYGYNNERLEFFFLIENVEDFNYVNLQKSTHGEVEIAECRWVDPTKEKGLLPEFLQDESLRDYVENVRPVLVRSEF